MKKRRLLFVLTFVIFVVLGMVHCIRVYVPYEKHLATIELPSGDRIIIKYYYDDFLSALVPQSGGLKYDIYSGESHSSGQLTHGSGYDMLQDVRLTHEIQGARRVKIEEGRRQYTWIFEGDSSGKYEIIGSYEQPQEID
jgi:hypothetical protein